MNVRDLLRKAEEMEVEPKYAITCRKRYLAGEIFTREMNIQAFEVESGDADLDYLRELLAIEDVKAIAEMKREIKRLNRALTNLDSRQITDEQIAIARAYPIDKLIKFTRGKATAPCHDDRNPSMYHGTIKNVAVCPVCDKKWGPLDWLIEIEGKTFIEAVKELAT